MKIQDTKIKPVLDPNFSPAILWNRSYQKTVQDSGQAIKFVIALERTNGTVSVQEEFILPHTGENKALNVKYTERLLKHLLWMKGGYKIYTAGCAELTEDISSIYSKEGQRAFDHNFMGTKVYGKPMQILNVSYEDIPASKEIAMPLGRNLDGCRIGFDLGGSDRKCAAINNGEVVFTEEIAWDPYFEKDVNYHIEGIRATLNRAASKLPRVDSIGGSAAGVYVNNEVRAASLFRGIAPEVFETHVRDIFFNFKEEWNGIPFEVVNDGEVTALAGSMSMNDNQVLGISMGTSLAAGYVNEDGNITPWLNELAFSPIDYRGDAPVDEWSGDIGCGVQYFSQQGVGRLISLAGITEIDSSLGLPEKLVEVQKLMAAGDERAYKIYETIGTCFGYTIAHYAEFYKIRNLLILGRVTSGEGGELIISQAKKVLEIEFPELATNIQLRTPNEQDKRHGQAVAAASLPALV